MAAHAVSMRQPHEKPVLSLKSCCLYQTDVALFADHAWLNDACIAFYFEVLQAKADVIFGRVVLTAEETKEISGQSAPGLSLGNRAQEKCKLECDSELVEEEGRRARTSFGWFSKSQREQGGMPNPPASSNSGNREKSVLREKGDSCTCRLNGFNHVADGREPPDVVCRRLLKLTLGEALQNDTPWLPILASLLNVKSTHQRAPGGAAGIDPADQSEHNRESHVIEESYRVRTVNHHYTPILFVDPCVAFWLSYSDDDEASAAIRDMYIERRQVVLWPVSDKQNLNAPGGTHWTLLVQVLQDRRGSSKQDGGERCLASEAPPEIPYAQQIGPQSCKENKFFHLNSLSWCTSPGASVAAAVQLQRRILAQLQRPYQSATHMRSVPELIECVCPQSNSSDCGVYCLMYAERILEGLAKWWSTNAEDTLRCCGVGTDSEDKVTGGSVVSEGTCRPFSLSFQEVQRIEPAETIAKRRAVSSLIESLENR